MGFFFLALVTVGVLYLLGRLYFQPSKKTAAVVVGARPTPKGIVEIDNNLFKCFHCGKCFDFDDANNHSCKK